MMKIGALRELIRGLPDSDELVLWEWREDDTETRSYFWDLQPVMDPKRHRGYVVLMENKYADEVKFNNK